ncbi:MAG: hypothetical protein C6Y20_02320 [Tagaea sp. CACIAM 22H2]|nr:hypothetical protein [Tagaea sp. CACIAM 22H2]
MKKPKRGKKSVGSTGGQDLAAKPNGNISASGALEPASIPTLEAEILQALPPSLPPEKAKIVISAVRSTVAQYSGPLPHPDHFAKYNAVLPDAAQRILVMAEKEQDHRQSWENRALDAQVADTKRGQFFGLIVAVMLCAGALYCSYIGQPWVASVMVGATFVGACGLFIRGRLHGNANKPERPTSPAKTGGKKK